jgi:hypothetical protein
MSISGSVVLYPTDAQPHPAGPAAAVSSILAALEGCKLVQGGTSAQVQDDRATFAVRPSAGPRSHAVIGPDKLLPAVGELVVTVSADELGADGDGIALPYLDVTALASSVALVNHDGTEACRSWAFVEFSWEDARLHPELHRVLDESHAVFAALAGALGGPIRWCVVSG